MSVNPVIQSKWVGGCAGGLAHIARIPAAAAQMELFNNSHSSKLLFSSELGISYSTGNDNN